ncbi:MAG: hypothetical protein IKO57_12200 [Treponema sp.]|nr:hypothetical protein [Treponema sp.]MBR4631178.1 hypothetical protein [Treponema sp.]
MKNRIKVIFLSGLLIIATLLIYKPHFTQKIIFLGDSLLIGYKIEKEKSAINLIEMSIPYKTVSRCNIGMTANACKSNINNLINERAIYVIIELGANDFLLGRSATETQKDLDAIIEFCQKRKSNVAIINFVDESMYNFCTTEKQVQLLADYADMYKKISAEKKIKLIDGIWQGKFGNAKYKIDYFHPNESGSKVIADTIIENILTWK